MSGKTRVTLRESQNHPVSKNQLHEVLVSGGKPRVCLVTQEAAPSPSASMELTSKVAALTNGGNTVHFRVEYDSSLGTNGATLAAGVLASCEQDYTSLQHLFSGLTPRNLRRESRSSLSNKSSGPFNFPLNLT